MGYYCTSYYAQNCNVLLRTKYNMNRALQTARTGGSWCANKSITRKRELTRVLRTDLSRLTTAVRGRLQQSFSSHRSSQFSKHLLQTLQIVYGRASTKAPIANSCCAGLVTCIMHTGFPRYNITIWYQVLHYIRQLYKYHNRVVIQSCIHTINTLSHLDNCTALCSLPKGHFGDWYDDTRGSL